MANIDISGLTLLAQRSPEIIGKLLNRDTVLRLFAAHEGYNPGPAILRLYEGGGDLSECCTIPETAGEFSEVNTTVACIMSGNSFCELDLAKYLNDLKFRFTAGSENIGERLANLIMDQELAKVALNLDRLTWYGDTTSADPNLNKIDGLIKLATNNLPANQQITISDGSLYEAFQNIIANIPLSAWDHSSTVDIFTSLTVGSALKTVLINLNLYHYNPGTYGDPYETFSFPGYGNVNIIPTRGLNKLNPNDPERIIVTPRSNIHWLTNLADDYMTLDWDYTKYHQLYYWRIKFLLGLTFGIYDDVLLVTLNPSVLTNAYCPCSGTTETPEGASLAIPQTAATKTKTTKTE